jgi:hypothetical protein
MGVKFIAQAQLLRVYALLLGLALLVLNFIISFTQKRIFIQRKLSKNNVLSTFEVVMQGLAQHFSRS